MIDQEIVKFLISWINENTIYEKFLLNLEIVALDLEELQFMACRGKCPILAFFSAPNIIYIAKLDFNDLCNQSILLHEMIHVFQYQSGSEMQNVFRENEAYQIQNKFLIDESLKTEASANDNGPKAVIQVTPMPTEYLNSDKSNS